MGPVTTQTYFGGVATFDEGIAVGFKHLGHEVLICSEQSDLDACRCLEGLQIYKISLTTAKHFFVREKPDLVIASLQYGKYFPLAKGSFRVLFLHGFFNVEKYGWAKSIAGAVCQKWMAMHCERVYSNSAFTAVMNQKMWKLYSDKVIPIGVSNTYLKEVLRDEKIVNANNGVITYVGRLEKTKGVDKIVDAVAFLQQQGKKFVLHIVGTGSFEAELKKRTAGLQYVEFLGRKQNSELLSIYKSSEIFISLHRAESFGITYAEALLGGCKIVCPVTGGQTEFLSSYPDRVVKVGSNETKEIAVALEKARKLHPQELQTQEVGTLFDYKTVAHKVERDFYEKRKN